MKNNVLKLIKNRYIKLSKSQKRISDYILINYSKVAFMTAKELSEKVETSESTVVRYAFSLGFEGYPEFIESLKETIKSKLTTAERFELTKSTENEGNVYKKVMKNDIDNIKATIKHNNYSCIKDVVHKLSNSKNIYILGLRSSKILADYFDYYLNLILNDINIKIIEGNNVFDILVKLKPGDTLVAFAFPRYTKLTIEALRYVKDNDISIVCITDSKNSPASKYSDFTLVADLSVSTFIDSLVAPMSLINTLIMELSIENEIIVEGKFNKLEKVWNEYDIFV